MPIIEAVDAIVSGGVDVAKVIPLLMSRDLKSEIGAVSFEERN